MLYYIAMTDSKRNETYYKQYKTVEGWNREKLNCWRFTKQGGNGIIKRLIERDKMFNRTWRTYELVKAD